MHTRTQIVRIFVNSISLFVLLNYRKNSSFLTFGICPYLGNSPKLGHVFDAHMLACPWLARFHPTRPSTQFSRCPRTRHGPKLRYPLTGPNLDLEFSNFHMASLRLT